LDPWARRSRSGRGESFRIIEIETEIDEELLEQGFNGVFTVEPC
jgi:hypothetical protein